MVAAPDAVVVHHASFCPCCSRIFTEEDVESVVQIFDTRTGLLHETSKEDTIFNKIQKGNPWIKVDIWE
jgi:hypothetical protein